MSFELEVVAEAGKALVEFIESAKKLQATYARANMTLPDAVRQLLGMNGDKDIPVAPVQIAPPERPTLPEGAEPHWISISERGAGATNVTLAVLRDADGQPVRAKDLNSRVADILPDVASGSVPNTGGRLEKAGIIERTSDGWILKNKERAGILANGLFWAPPEICTVHELAAHRRDSILYLLKQFPSGLQQLQLLDVLRACSWMHAPVNKDLLKEDIEVLKVEGKVRRRGNTKKLELVEPKPIRLGGTEMRISTTGT